MILLAGTFGSFMTLPGQTAGVSVFIDPIIAELDISRTTVSVAYTTGTLAGVLPAPIIGRWIDRRGPRIAATIIVAGLAAACLYMAVVQSASMLFLGFALLRGAAIGGLSLVSQHIVNLWFVHRRGIAAAAGSIGLATGSMAFPPIFNWLIGNYGWRAAYVSVAALITVTMLPVAMSLFRDRPEKYGMTVDAGLPAIIKATAEEPSFTRAEALRTGAFWLLCAIGFLTNAVGTALLLNHFSIMGAMNVDRSQAVSVLIAYATVQAALTLGTGAMLDRYEPRRLVPFAMILLALTSSLPIAGQGTLVGWVYAMCLGAAYGSQQAISAAGFARYFGRDHLGAIRGASFVFGISGAAFGPLPFAFSVELTGSYFAALVASLALALACATASFYVSAPKLAA
ncbi:MFS transporter [Bradyrhizobium stylosanthis]|uniref:MFS transporter n=1 Tax=Bradyrhizobium stylosanthis TaxID=1803665 RepID=UPI001428CA26|nr:MFS transporter [Bradyrhizobium stylosanthis]